MIQQSINRLQWLCDNMPQQLLAINDNDFSHKPAPEKWSKKEIIGHLIDSATNNHQRFVRAQFERKPFIVYDQNKWNAASYYQQMDGKQLVQFWAAYNRQLLALIQLIPAEKLLLTVNTGDDNDSTLSFLFNDYVVHLEHHLQAIISY